MKNNILKDKSYAFAIQIVKASQLLIQERKEYILSKQLLRSGTAIGALIREAEFGQSKADFINKMSISLKEANETLDFFPSGTIPPNPQELISGIYMKKIKDYLDENYDVIIIDTPPFGIVADAQILGEWADVTLVLTRFQQTIGEQVQDINKWQDRRIFKSMAIVFNGVKNKGYFGNKYGNYYYKRKYGYSYYNSVDADT